MAIYKLAPSAPRILGSRGGSTFQRGSKIFMIRKRSVPVQKRSVKQSRVKNIFDHVAKRWKNLNPGQRNSFNNRASGYPRTDSLGNSYILRGQQMQQSSNQNLIIASLPPINTLPFASAFPAISLSSISVQYVSETFGFGVSPSTVPADITYQLYASQIVQTIQESSTLQFKLIASAAPGTNMNTANYWQNYVAIFGSPANRDNEVIFGMLIPISNASGQADTAKVAPGDIEQ